MRNENPNVDDGNDGDVAIVTIKDSMCKFVFKYNENSYEYFQSPKSTIFQLKQLLAHTIFSVTNPNLQVTQIFTLEKSMKIALLQRMFLIKNCSHYYYNG